MEAWRRWVVVLLIVFTTFDLASLDALPFVPECGIQFFGRRCSDNRCCSILGFCGTTDSYCGAGCQSQCTRPPPPSPPPPPPSPPPPSPPPPSPPPPSPPPPSPPPPSPPPPSPPPPSPPPPSPPPPSPPPPSPSPPPPSPPPPSPPPPSPPPPPPAGGSAVEEILTEELFNNILLHKDDSEECSGGTLHTYSTFIAATKAYPEFASSGDLATRKLELAAFLAQTSYETTGGWDDAPDGKYAWGYCYMEEIGGEYGPDFCVPDPHWRCATGQKYYGRGPFHIRYNTNYGRAGEALGINLLDDPGIVSRDGLVSFETALWRWMTPDYPIPSLHDVMTGRWSPSAADVKARRIAGYGLTTNIINGKVECGHGVDERVIDRIGFYIRVQNILNVTDVKNLDCFYQGPFIDDADHDIDQSRAYM